MSYTPQVLSVPKGGTGVATTTAYAVQCGGTTATGAHQNVSGVGSSGQVLTSGGAGVLPTWASSSGIATVTGQIVTATGAFTYTPTANMKFVIVELQGAGGGSGGNDSIAASVGASGSGGAGGYVKFILTAAQVGASLTGSVGAGGAGGAAGANNGSAGGNTTLATAAAWTAGGGALGTGSTSVAGSTFTRNGGAGGTNAVGTGTVLVNINGGTGQYSARYHTSV